LSDIRKNGKFMVDAKSGRKVIKPEFTALMNLEKMIRDLESDLGLSPAARQRLKIMPKEPEKTKIRNAKPTGLKLYDQYIQQVSEDKIITPQTIKQAVARHIKDIKASCKKNYPYYFDEEQADKYIRFIGKFRLTDQDADENGMKPLFPVQPFQHFLLHLYVGGDSKKTTQYVDSRIFTSR
jgi:hypothetical protein